MQKEYQVGEEVIAQAKKEIEEEFFREAVERHKKWLREKRSFWDRIFPWKIVLVRKDKYDRR